MCCGSEFHRVRAAEGLVFQSVVLSPDEGGQEVRINRLEAACGGMAVKEVGKIRGGRII